MRSHTTGAIKLAMTGIGTVAPISSILSLLILYTYVASKNVVGR